MDAALPGGGPPVAGLSSHHPPFGGDPIQTVLVIQSAEAGAVYLNGRMAGETDAEHPLCLPVSPFGALILEMRPFAPALMPLSLRLPLSRGAPILTAPDPRMSIALWPGGVIEIELIPERVPSPARFLIQSGGVRFFMKEGPQPLLRCESAASVREYPLPEGANAPELTPLPNSLLMTGQRGGGDQYALVLAPDASSLLLSVTGKNISLLEGSAALRLMHPFGDTVGHASLETWAASPAGWQLSSSEPMWEHGAPIHPASPEATAVAAVEAAQLGLLHEAEAYFSPTCPHAEILARVQEYDGCTPLRCALPGGESAVGLMKLRDGVLHIIPAKYAVQPGGRLGGYLLTKLEITEKPQT